MEKYEVINNNKTYNLPAGPNICGETEDDKPESGTIKVGSGRQQFRVNVDFRNCAGIYMLLSIKTVIS